MKRYLLLLFLALATIIGYGQDDGSANKKVKKAEAKKEQRIKNRKKAELQGRKRHEAIQDKAVRKRMKKKRKGPIHVDAYDRRPFFIKRWLKKKEH